MQTTPLFGTWLRRSTLNLNLNVDLCLFCKLGRRWSRYNSCDGCTVVCHSTAYHQDLGMASNMWYLTVQPVQQNPLP
jgi:hypothetical protein